jgi:hypothetical protein
LNEHLARRANIEDNCDGRFWSGRFRSQALLDEASLLTAMAYVDLNPIRAGIAKIPEDSGFTSIYDRIRFLRDHEGESSPSIPLRSFSDEGQGSTATIPFRLRDYLALVDWSGRSIRAGKRGFIAADAPPILKRLNIDAEAWEVLMTRRRTLFGRAMGKVDACDCMLPVSGNRGSEASELLSGFIRTEALALEHRNEFWRTAFQ